MARLADLIRTLEPEAVDLSRVFDEEPVDLTTFVQDSKFLKNPPLSDEQYWAVRYSEQIYLPDTYPMMVAEFGRYWEPVRMVNEITLEWGKGSGKDHICRIISMRIAYLLLCLKSPQEYFALPAQDTIHELNVASSAHQAQQAFFKPMSEAVKRGWFKDRCEPKQNLISWEKNIESISGHSDAETQEGLNLILGVADEIDAFRSKEELERYQARGAREPTKSAEGILKMLKTSASTRFPLTYKNVRISYPRFLGSTIQSLRKKAHQDIEKRGPASRHYVSGPKYTWHVNPRFKDVEMVRVAGISEPVPVVYQQDFEDTPDMAKAMYMCQPSRATSPYFRNEEAIEACMVDREPITVSYRLQANGRGAHVWVPDFDIADSFRPIAGAIYAMHGDLAVKSDRAGIAMAHVVTWSEHEMLTEDEEGGLVTKTEVRPVIKVDFAIALEADLACHPPREIQIRWARQLCWRLQERGFPIKMFTYDGWQSTDSMQILNNWGIESKRESTDLSEDAWKTLRDVTYEARCTLPRSDLLRQELLSLTRLSSGKVDHPAGGSKDMADAVACAVKGAIEVGGRESETGEVVYPQDSSFDLVYSDHLLDGLTVDSLRWSH